MKRGKVWKQIGAAILSGVMVLSSSGISVLAEEMVVISEETMESGTEEVVVAENEPEAEMVPEETEETMEEEIVAVEELVEETGVIAEDSLEDSTEIVMDDAEIITVEDVGEEQILGDTAYEEIVNSEIDAVNADATYITDIAVECMTTYSAASIREELEELPLKVTYSDGTTKTKYLTWTEKELNGIKVLFLGYDGVRVYLKLENAEGMIDIPDEGDTYIPVGEFTLVAFLDGNEAISCTNEIIINGVPESVEEAKVNTNINYDLERNWNMNDNYEYVEKWISFTPNKDKNYVYKVRETESACISAKVIQICDGGLKICDSRTFYQWHEESHSLSVKKNETYFIVLIADSNSAGSIILEEKTEIAGITLKNIKSPYHSLALFASAIVKSYEYEYDPKAVIAYADGSSEEISINGYGDMHYGVTKYGDEVFFELADYNGYVRYAYETMSIPLAKLTLNVFLKEGEERLHECSQEIVVDDMMSSAKELTIGNSFTYELEVSDGERITDKGEAWYSLPQGISGDHIINIHNPYGIVAVFLYEKTDDYLVFCDWENADEEFSLDKINYNFDSGKEYVLGLAVGWNDCSDVQDEDRAKGVILLEKGTVHAQHAWDEENVVVSATCTTPGQIVRSCTICGEKKEPETVEAGHKFSGWSILTEATFAQAEKQVNKCSVCGETESRTVGSPLPKTITVTADSITLKTKQSTTGFKVSGLADGDSIVSMTLNSSKYVKISKVNLKSGTCKLTAQKKKGKATLTIKLKSGLVKEIPIKVQTSDVKTTGISGVEKKLTLKKGNKLTLKPVLTPFTSREKIKYSSSDKKVVKVSSKGTLTAVKPGKAKITIQAGKKKFTCTVTVEGVKNTGLKGIQKKLSLKKGASKTLKPKRVPSDSTDKITYSSSNKKVATVSSAGKITAKKKGTAVITVKCGSAKVTCKVTVK